MKNQILPLIVMAAAIKTLNYANAHYSAPGMAYYAGFAFVAFCVAGTRSLYFITK